jgi:hypothetical protein
MKQIGLGFSSVHDTPSAINATSEFSVSGLTCSQKHAFIGFYSNGENPPCKSFTWVKKNWLNVGSMARKLVSLAHLTI